MDKKEMEKTINRHELILGTMGQKLTDFMEKIENTQAEILTNVKDTNGKIAQAQRDIYELKSSGSDHSKELAASSQVGFRILFICVGLLFVYVIVKDPGSINLFSKVF